MTTECVSERTVSPAVPNPPSKGRSRAILKNTLSSYLRDLIDVATLIVLTPFLIRTLGRDGFGLWSLVWAFVSILTFLDLGFGTSVVKFVADARGRGDPDRQRKVVCTLFWVYVILGSVLMLAICCSLPFFNEMLSIPPGDRSTTSWILVMLGFRAAVCMPFGMFRGVLNGNQKLHVANLYKILAALLYFGGALALLSRFPDLRVLAAVNMVTGILPMLAMYLHAKKTLPGITLNFSYFDRGLVREVSSFSIYFTIIQIAGLIATRVDSLIIQSFLSLEMVAIYSVAMRLSEKAQQFCSHLTQALTPVIAELHGAGERENMRAVWFRGTKLTLAFATPLLLGLCMLAEPLIVAWTGREFALGAPVLQWLCAAAFLDIAHGSSTNLLSMGGHQRYLAFSLLGGQILNMVLCITFVRTFGIVGVSIATFAAAVPTSIGLVQGRASSVYGCPIWKFYGKTIGPCLVPGIITGGFLYWAVSSGFVSSLFRVALLEVVAVVLFGLFFWPLGLNARERAYFKDKLLARVRTSRG
jgi:O-antigen/teichoic acid export membrane protein